MVDSTTTLSSLPTELLAKIAGQVNEEEQDEALDPGRRVFETLLALSTVSHAWNQVTQPLIYRSIAIRDSDRFPRQLEILLHTLESKPRLASLVRELTFELWSSGVVASKDLFAQVARIASLSQNLTRLDLGSCWSMEDDDLLKIVEKCRSLEELSIATCEKISSGGLRKVLPFLTNLRKLDVAELFRIDDECLRDIVRACPLLEDLDLWKTSVTSTGVLSIVDLAAKLASLNLSPSGEPHDSEMETMRIKKPPHFKITAYDHHESYGDSNSGGSYFSDNDLYIDSYEAEDYNEDWDDDYDDMP
ncbi:hypothetical protein DFS34DRAFT_268000 [Phlyctochytrium arcticum]|nr:hypothetical protein DFS34DRAFT_689467 [Phlyctochytrium arcticum]KAI9093543.1 hypothetical protein DFS34DRAFT_268000 [Phlyctochytrium arcticum]